MELIERKKSYVEQLRPLEAGGKGIEIPAEKMSSVRSAFFTNRKEFPGWKISVKAIDDKPGYAGVWRVK